MSLEATVKNMLTSLRAVAELQNPAIRERHWRQLMNSTKVPAEVKKRRIGLRKELKAKLQKH